MLFFMSFYIGKSLVEVGTKKIVTLRCATLHPNVQGLALGQGAKCKTIHMISLDYATARSEHQ